MSDMRLAIDFLNVLQKKYPSLMNEDRSEGKSDFEIYPYVNGREKGFALVKSEYDTKQHGDFRVIVFAEHRNSDRLRMFYGINKEFDDDEWHKFKGLHNKKYLVITNINRHFIPSELIYRTQEKNIDLDSAKQVVQAVKFVRDYFK